MPDIGERVAVLEAREEDTQEVLKAIHARLDELHRDMTRYKGFLGGVTFVLSCLGTFFAFGKDWLLQHWK